MSASQNQVNISPHRAFLHPAVLIGTQPLVYVSELSSFNPREGRSGGELKIKAGWGAVQVKGFRVEQH